ncbi:MFS general substrate transporter [Aaosphaeria arxii CBS 175.79]|uniref:MFS general substrate transporter n=1 Tax=Aaosphaeria arxii CBS 175.79 TaxID=1450172 RepID=A0A6A5YAC6_9PLEO|nr:MFS general substrate transporter [Aaosphaeria arxii CBS 175.79]KAF2022176.1 MFS general substrate transporter [Aaosphaeria arxii CBS 175.79]
MEKSTITTDDSEESRNVQLPTPPFDKVAEARILKKLDLKVLPILWLLYLVCFVDRSNIGNAKIQGMDQELELKGQRYNIAVFVFNIGYLIAGVPLSILFKKTGPKSLSVMMFCWGITVIGCGLTKSFAGLVVCRLLEGMAEAAFVPGAAYLIGSYYRRNEFLRRYVVFFSAGICAGAFNGFLSSLIAKMDGVSGYQAWRWIFIIEGCITIAISFGSWFLIVPFPEDCTFFNEKDKALLLARLKDDGGAVAHDNLPIKRILDFYRDWKIWIAILIYLGAAENANSITSFQPTILKGIGYTSTGAQVRTIPVYLVAAVYSMSLAYTAEYLQRRYVFFMVGYCTIATGLIVEIIQPRSAGVRYMGLFFMTAGAYLNMPMSVVWIAINVGKGYKRSVALGSIVCFGNVGAFVSTNVFLKREEPRYHTGFSTGLGLCSMGMVAATIMFVGCYVGNKRRNERRKELPDVLDEGSIEDLGEKHPDFRYSL